MRIHFKLFTTDDIEDVGLGNLILKVDRTGKVSREQVMQKLGEEYI